MPLYGGSGIEIQYTYIAVFPLKAEHPVGSGLIVHYKPGDEIPAGEWGNAAHNLVEMGKAVRLATNVAKGSGGSSGVPTVSPAPDPVADTSHVTGYPKRDGGGWFTLSDGSRVRGEDVAVSMQADLDEQGS